MSSQNQLDSWLTRGISCTMVSFSIPVLRLLHSVSCSAFCIFIFISFHYLPFNASRSSFCLSFGISLSFVGVTIGFLVLCAFISSIAFNSFWCVGFQLAFCFLVTSLLSSWVVPYRRAYVACRPAYALACGRQTICM